MTINNQKSVLVINGPNLNLLGTREPQVYGSTTLDDVVKSGQEQAKRLGAHIDFFQSNTEGFIIDRIQQARTDGTDGIVINPGGLTHTSVSLRDALLGVDIPFVEIHVTNPHSREPFRHHSYLSDKSKAIIAGCGTRGYEYAIDHVIKDFPERSIPK